MWTLDVGVALVADTTPPITHAPTAIEQNALAERILLVVPAQGALQVLRVLQMRHERRPHLDQQLFQLDIVRVGDQGSVQRIQDALVIGDFMVVS